MTNQPFQPSGHGAAAGLLRLHHGWLRGGGVGRAGCVCWSTGGKGAGWMDGWTGGWVDGEQYSFHLSETNKSSRNPAAGTYPVVGRITAGVDPDEKGPLLLRLYAVMCAIQTDVI